MNRLINNLAKHPNVQMLAGLMWSFSAVTIKSLTIQQGLDIFFISSIRSAIGFAFLLPLFWVKWDTRADDQENESHEEPERKPFGVLPPGLLWTVSMFGGCSLAANTFLLCWAFEHTESLTPMFMHYTGLLLVAFVSGKTLQYTPKPREWLVCVMAVVGVTALVYHGLVFDGSPATIVSIAAGVTQFLGQWSIAYLSNYDKALQKHTGQKSARGANVFRIGEVITIPAGLVISFSTTSSYARLDNDAVLKLIFLGVVTWGLPNFIALLGVRRINFVTAKLFWLADAACVPLWPVLAGYDPVPASLAWFGAILILIGSFIHRFYEYLDEQNRLK